jgi:fatty acid desaturase
VKGRVENIGPRGARRRQLGGAAWLVVALAAAALLVSLGAPRWWRLALVVPFGLAAIGFLQARERT